MSKKNKRGILNQIIDEPEETKEEIIEKEPMIIDPEVFKVEQPEVEELAAPEEVVTEEELMEVPEEPKVVHFEFQEEYQLVHNGKDAVIDELPIEEPMVRSIDSLTKSELREFQRTGKMPQ